MENNEIELIYLLRDYGLTISYIGKSWVITVEYPYKFRSTNRNLIGGLLEITAKIYNAL